MAYTVHIANKPKKFVEKLFPDYKNTIEEWLKQLENDPYPRGCIPLEGKPHCYRVRIGSFRVQYAVSEQEKIIMVFKISRRDETTYK